MKSTNNEVSSFAHYKQRRSELRGNTATEVPLLVEVDATAMKHKEDCLVQDSAQMRRDQATGGGRRDNTPSSLSVAGPQAPNDARTTRRRESIRINAMLVQVASAQMFVMLVQVAKNAVLQCSGSCTRKTTTMSAAQGVFCKTLVDGVCWKCGGFRRRL
ncbi:hypothetical protein BHM03_00019023 [Ensete ventricosum]|nr:hypothetical protein BHM03_00019023 [Ensete ventricosum]